MVVIKKMSQGKYILINDEPCRVLSVQSAVTSKHGSAKTRLEAVGILDGKKRCIVKPANTNVQVPTILKKTAQVLSILGDKAQIMDMEDYSIFDIEIPTELKSNIENGKEILYWEISGKKILKELKQS